MDLTKNILRVIIKQKLIKPSDTIVVGVSGGADSVCLLHVLYQLRLRLGFKIHVAHYNHRLRLSADRDEAFVVSLAQNLNLPVTVDRRKTALTSKSVSEDTARQWRLGFFTKTARAIKASSVVLAHTQNDLAETVLMRLLRGAGLLGLRGILVKNRIDQTNYIRPFLTVSRVEIETYLKKHHLRFCKDETNQQTHYLRNQIRLKLLPQLVKEYNPNLSGVLIDLAYTAQGDYDFIVQCAEKQFKDKAVCRRGKVTIPLKWHLNQHESIQRMLLRLSFEHLVFNVNQLSVVHIQEAEDMLLNRPIGSAVHWPKGVSVLKTKSELVVKLPMRS